MQYLRYGGRYGGEMEEVRLVALVCRKGDPVGGLGVGERGCGLKLGMGMEGLLGVRSRVVEGG